LSAESLLRAAQALSAESLLRAAQALSAESLLRAAQALSAESLLRAAPADRATYTSRELQRTVAQAGSDIFLSNQRSSLVVELENSISRTRIACLKSRDSSRICSHRLGLSSRR